MFDPRLINLFKCMFILYSAARNHRYPCYIQCNTPNYMIHCTYFKKGRKLTPSLACFQARRHWSYFHLRKNDVSPKWIKAPLNN